VSSLADLMALSGEPELGGVVVRFDAAAAQALGRSPLAFLPVASARRMAFASSAVHLGGAPPLALGLALVEGRLLTLVAVGEIAPRGPVVVCERAEGEPFALGVEEVVASGLFPASAGGVLGFDAAPLPPFDVEVLLTQLESAVWLQRTDRPPSSMPPSHRSPRP
jgi:hypothetical protein